MAVVVIAIAVVAAVVATVADKAALVAPVAQGAARVALAAHAGNQMTRVKRAVAGSPGRRVWSDDNG